MKRYVERGDAIINARDGKYRAIDKHMRRAGILEGKNVRSELQSIDPRNSIPVSLFSSLINVQSVLSVNHKLNFIYLRLF